MKENQLPTGERSKDIAKISVKFKELMQKGNVNGALKLLSNEMSNDILPLTEETLSQLEIKHPDNGDASADVLLNGPIKQIHPIVFDAIDEEMVLRAASIIRSVWLKCIWLETNVNPKFIWYSFLRSSQINSIPYHKNLQ